MKNLLLRIIQVWLDQRGYISLASSEIVQEESTIYFTSSYSNFRYQFWFSSCFNRPFCEARSQEECNFHNDHMQLKLMGHCYASHCEFAATERWRLQL
ncbi:hypothetical protein P3L10_034442 [Capsicum annuum]